MRTTPLFAALVVLAASTDASACSCIWPEGKADKQHFNEMSAVFLGEFKGAKIVTRQSNPTQSVEISRGEFAVIEALKGTQGPTVFVDYPEDDGMNCGVSFEVGGQYHVFAFRIRTGELQTTECEGTHQASPADDSQWKKYRKIARRAARRARS